MFSPYIYRHFLYPKERPSLKFGYPRQLSQLFNNPKPTLPRTPIYYIDFPLTLSHKESYHGGGGEVINRSIVKIQVIPQIKYSQAPSSNTIGPKQRLPNFSHTLCLSVSAIGLGRQNHWMLSNCGGVGGGVSINRKRKHKKKYALSHVTKKNSVKREAKVRLIANHGYLTQSLSHTVKIAPPPHV